MTTLNVYPLNVKEFIVETLRLPVWCKAAYLMILLDYCTRGEPPPDDDHVLMQITSSTPDEWLKNDRPLLAPLFDIRDGKWYHKGIEAELERARLTKDNAARASKIAGNKRRKAPVELSQDRVKIGEQFDEAYKAAAADAFAHGVGTTVAHIPIAELTAPAPPAVTHTDVAATMEPLSEDFVLTGEDVIECQTRGATLDEIADWLDYFRSYHLKAGTLAEDWTALWFRLVDRKIEERDKTARKAKPRVELSRRAPAPPPT